MKIDKHRKEQNVTRLDDDGGAKWYSSTDAAVLAEGKSMEEQDMKKAMELLRTEEQNAVTPSSANKEDDWLKMVAAGGGTLADQVAALTVMVQRSPLVSLKQLDKLISNLKKKARREALSAIDIVRDLFIKDLLPDRTLVPLRNRVKSKKSQTMLLFAFEGELKQRFNEFVDCLAKLAQDALPSVRGRALTAMTDLAVAKPEQRSRLIGNIANKLGDQDKKVSSRAVQSLSRLVQERRELKHEIVAAVKSLVFRANISQRAQYYALCFLETVPLSGKPDQDGNQQESELAANLLLVYLSIFRVLIDRNDLENRLLDRLLIGCNKAFPHAKSQLDAISQHMDALYGLAAQGKPKLALSCYSLLLQLVDHSASSADRFYCSLFRRLADASFIRLPASHQPHLLSLLEHCLRADSHLPRQRALLKRLLQLALHSPSPGFAAGVLLTISKLAAENAALVRRDDPFKLSAGEAAVKQEGAAEVKEEVNGEAKKPIISNAKLRKYGGESDSDEHFEDAGEADDKKASKAKLKNKSSSTWVHRDHARDAKLKVDFDPTARNPLYAGADCTLDYELLLLSRHYHPSVAAFAQQVLTGHTIEYTSNPFEDFSLIRFLDRFVYKNPKKDSKEMRVMKRKRSYDPWAQARALKVDTEAYTARDESSVPPEERFIHKFLNAQEKEAGPKKKAKRKKEKELDEEDDGDMIGSDIESVDSDEAEQFLEQQLEDGVNLSDWSDDEGLQDARDGKIAGEKMGRRGKKRK